MANTPKNTQTTKVAKRRTKTAPAVAGPTTRRSSAQDRRERKAKSQAPVSSPPPVMARGYRMEVPFQGNASYTRKGRRRIDLPLNVPGAEMRLPSLPTWKAISRWMWLGLLIGLVGLLYFLWSAPFFRVEAAQVEGARQVKSGDVNAVLGVSGESIFMLRPAKLEKELQAAFPEFSAVDIQVKLPNTLMVTVAERTPVLTWHQGDTNQLIDQAGFAFPLRMASTTLISPVIEAAGSPPSQAVTAVDAAAIIAESAALAAKADQKDETELPLVEAKPAEPFLKPEMVAAILAVSEALPPTVAIIYDPEHGLGWQDEGGWQVYLGDDRDIEMKLKVYEAIVQRLMDEEIQPTLISIEHVHNPYFQAEQTN